MTSPRKVPSGTPLSFFFFFFFKSLRDEEEQQVSQVDNVTNTRRRMRMWLLLTLYPLLRLLRGIVQVRHCTPNHQRGGVQNGKISRNMCALQFVVFFFSHASRRLACSVGDYRQKVSASELGRKFIRSALLVGLDGDATRPPTPPTPTRQPCILIIPFICYYYFLPSSAAT